MAIRIGRLINLFFILICWGFTPKICYANESKSIELKLLATNGAPINKIPVGVPFHLDVTLKNFDQNNIEPREISGLDSFEILNKYSTQKMSFINGIKSAETIYTYELRSDKEGKVKIGPAQLDSINIQSNSVVITIVPAGKTEYIAGPELLSLVDSNEIFVGQKVHFLIRFGYPESNLSLSNMHYPEINGIQISKITGPKSRKESRNGADFNVLEWEGYLYPEKTGDYVIPALRAEYTTALPSISFFGPRLKREHVYSNAIKLKVLELPKTTKKIDAVGQFNSFTAKIDHNKVQQGDGIVLNLAIDGFADFDKIKITPQNIPPEIKYYESGVQVEESKSGQIKKFEFILQGLEVGKYTIKPQIFSYFDPIERRYKKLITKPIVIEILPGTAPISQKVTPIKISEQATNLAKNKENNILKEYTIDSSAKNKPYFIPWPIFFISLIFGIMFAILIWLFNILRSKHKNLGGAPNYYTKMTFKKARLLIKKAMLSQNLSNCHVILKTLLNSYFGTCQEGVTPDSQKLLSNAGFDNKTIKAWQEFDNTLLSFTFFSPDVSKNRFEPRSEVFAQIFRWIDIFEAQFNKNRKINFLLLIIFIPQLISSVSSIDLNVLPPDQNKIAQIINLRRLQLCASGTDIYQIEKKVDEIKAQIGYENKSRYNKNLLYLYSKLTIVPLLVWQLLFILLWWYFLLFARLNKKKYQILLLFLLLIFGIVNGIIGYIQSIDWAIVNKSKAELFVGPDKEYPTKGYLVYLDEVRIIKKHNSWYYVRHAVPNSNSIKGWIQSPDVMII